MREIKTLDDISRDLIDSVRAMEKGEIQPRELAVKRNAYETVVKIAQLKLSAYVALREEPSTPIFLIAK